MIRVKVSKIKLRVSDDRSRLSELIVVNWRKKIKLLLFEMVQLSYRENLIKSL